jgi:signal transduction histidine kinase
MANHKLNLLSSITRHDINNKLTVIKSYLALLKKDHADPATADKYGKITTAAQQISAMIWFTKEYENIGVNAPVWQDCRQLIEAAAGQVAERQVQVRNDIPADTEIFADPLIAKVWYNLLENAVRHGGKITTVRFFEENAGGGPVIVCEDDGDGVPADEKEKIFERGFGKNTGLGLFLTREILAITGITITETGEPGKGARFEIAVPKGGYRFTGEP